MARIARVVGPGIPHHITQRGNRRQQTFFNEDDFREYISLMGEWFKEYGTEVWAFKWYGTPEEEMKEIQCHDRSNSPVDGAEGDAGQENWIPIKGETSCLHGSSQSKIIHDLSRALT